MMKAAFESQMSLLITWLIIIKWLGMFGVSALGSTRIQEEWSYLFGAAAGMRFNRIRFIQGNLKQQISLLVSSRSVSSFNFHSPVGYWVSDLSQNLDERYVKKTWIPNINTHRLSFYFIFYFSDGCYFSRFVKLEDHAALVSPHWNLETVELVIKLSSPQWSTTSMTHDFSWKWKIKTSDTQLVLWQYSSSSSWPWAMDLGSA